METWKFKLGQEDRTIGYAGGDSREKIAGREALDM